MPQATTTSRWWGRNSDPGPRAPGWGVSGEILQPSECSACRRLDTVGTVGQLTLYLHRMFLGKCSLPAPSQLEVFPPKGALGNGTDDEANYRFPSASHFRSQSHPPQAWETSPVLSRSAVDTLMAGAPVGAWPCDSSGGWSQVMKRIVGHDEKPGGTRHMSPHEAGTVVRSTVQWSCLSQACHKTHFCISIHLVLATVPVLSWCGRSRYCANT